MNKTTKEWKEIFKKLNMKPWDIGTNTFTYLENSLFKWWNNINWDSNLNLYLLKVNTNDEKEGFKVVFEQDESIIFYTSNEEFYSKTTSRQLLDILKALEIVKELDKKNYKIHPRFKNFFLSSNKNEGIEKIFWSFFIENIDSFLKKYIWEKLDLYENEGENENIEDVEDGKDVKNGKKEKNIENKFWWNIILAYEDLRGKKIISDIIFSKKAKYFDNFAQQIIDRKHSLEQFYSNFFKITSFEYTSMWDNIDISIISSNSNEQGISKCNFENCEINHTSLKHKIRKASEGNKFESFGITIPELFELSFMLELPIFQRTYSWNENMISHLFESIYNDFNSNSNDFTFLNTIIIANPGFEQLVILDGQQRTVSIILIAIALARWAKQNHNKTLEKIENQIFTKNNNIKKIIETWLKTDINYKNLNFIFLGDNKNLNKQTNFARNYYEICKLVQKKFQNNNLDFPGFVDYFLSKIHFVVAYTGDTRGDSSRMTKIFQNLNQYSKPLGVLDLFRNQIYEFYKNKKNTNAEDYVLIYNQTINLFFRNSNKTDEVERVNIINVFTDTIFIKYEQFSDLKEIDEKYYDPIAKILQKLWKIFDYFHSKDLDPLLELFKELIDFQFCLDGVISNFKISRPDNEDKSNKKYNFFYTNLKNLFEKTHLASRFANELTKYSDKIAEYDFLGSQIMHISGQGKTVFAPLISLLKKRAKIDFSYNIDSHDLNSKISYFSKQLFEIEKFSILWRFNFEGQSLTKKINKICEDISKGKVDDTNLLFYLKQTISSLDTSKSDEDWANEIYTKLSNKLNSSYESNNNSKNKNKDLRLIWIRLMYGMNDEQTPKYYNKNSTSLDFLNSTYEHCIPKKLKGPEYNKYSQEDRKQLKWYADNNIGNGALLTQKANSKRGNKFNKINTDFHNTTIIGGQMSGKLIISVKENMYNLNGTVLELLPSPETLIKQNSSCVKIINHIQERAAQVLSGYVSIFFGSDNK